MKETQYCYLMAAIYIAPNMTATQRFLFGGFFCVAGCVHWYVEERKKRATP